MASKRPTLDEALEDVEARFLYNQPEDELRTADRLFFQIEQAYWYYEDFKADKHSHLPHFSKLKSFAEKVFKHCELLSKMGDKFAELFEDFRNYKSKIPVCGCILLNPKMNKVLLVCDYNSKSWMFPRGKINENETEFDCAVREVTEEIGFDPTDHCNEEDNLVVFQDGKKVTLYIAMNVVEDTIFQTQTRKEISKIQFFPIDALPSGCYCVHPFLPKLRRWISKHTRMATKSPASLLKTPPPLPPSKIQDILKEQQHQLRSEGRSKSSNKRRANSVDKAASGKVVSASQQSPSPNTMKRIKNLFDMRNSDTFAEEGSGDKGWKVDDMFAANAKLTGRNYVYSGNPHEFGASHPRYVNYGSALVPSKVTMGGAGIAMRSSAGIKKSGSSSSLELQELSQQSLLGHELLQKAKLEHLAAVAKGESEGEATQEPAGGRQKKQKASQSSKGDGLPEFSSLPAPKVKAGKSKRSSAEQQEEFNISLLTQDSAWKLKRVFPKPFKLNIADIMGSVDDVLRRTAEVL